MFKDRGWYGDHKPSFPSVYFYCSIIPFTMTKQLLGNQVPRQHVSCLHCFWLVCSADSVCCLSAFSVWDKKQQASASISPYFRSTDSFMEKKKIVVVSVDLLHLSGKVTTDSTDYLWHYKYKWQFWSSQSCFLDNLHYVYSYTVEIKM